MKADMSRRFRPPACSKSGHPQIAVRQQRCQPVPHSAVGLPGKELNRFDKIAFNIKFGIDKSQCRRLGTGSYQPIPVPLVIDHEGKLRATFAATA